MTLKDKPWLTWVAWAIFTLVIVGLNMFWVLPMVEKYYEQIPTLESLPSLTPTPTSLPTSTPTLEPPTPTPMQAGWRLVHGIAVSPDEQELLARLIYLECNAWETSLPRTDCALSVIHTVIWRATQGYLTDDPTVTSVLLWGVSPNRQQQFPNGVLECQPEATRCPDNVNLSIWRELVSLYFDGGRGSYSGAHYGSKPDWPYKRQLVRDSAFIGWFNHWYSEFPTPSYCGSQGTTIPREFGLEWPIETREVIGWHNQYGHDNGVDFQGGDVVQVAYPGEIIYAGLSDTPELYTIYDTWGPSYGNFVVIAHWTHVGQQRLVTIYAHLAEVPYGLEVGEIIPQGAPLGVVGSTGHSIGDHLHFEVYLMPERQSDQSLIDWLSSGEPMNPLAYLCQNDKNWSK